MSRRDQPSIPTVLEALAHTKGMVEHTAARLFPNDEHQAWMFIVMVGIELMAASTQKEEYVERLFNGMMAKAGSPWRMSRVN